MGAYDTAHFLSVINFCVSPPIAMVKNSKSLRELIKKSYEPRKMRVEVELALLREAYELGEISKVRWVLTKNWPTDVRNMKR